MKKQAKFTLLLIAVLMLFALGTSADRTLPLLVDDGELLSDAEYDEVLAELIELSEKNCCEIAVVSVYSLDGKSAMAYADDFYDENGYGYGENDDGMLLLVAMNDREYYITTYGAAHQKLDDYALMQIEDAFLDDLSDGNYRRAFLSFASECDWQLYLADEYADESFDVSGAILISLIVGFIVALILVFVMKGKMTTVRSATNAQNYVKANSLTLTRESDRFLYAQTKRIPLSDGDSGGGHHTSSHTSSSGRSHGGRGGKF